MGRDEVDASTHRRIDASTHRRIDASTHRRIDASTRRNDSLVTTAFEHAPIGMALLSPQGAWLRVNEALCKLLGYSASELLATTFWKVTHPDDRDASLQQLRRLLAGEMNHYETETRYLRRSGAVMWGLLSVSLGRTAEGTPELFIVQIVDLTERNAAERREASLRSTESTKHGQPVEVSGVVQDITQRRKLEDTFRFLAQHSGASDGEGFFRPLARYLARALDAECICVDRLVGDGRSAETLAAFRDGSFDDDLVYALEGTPCGVAIGQDVCVFPADVRERFPLDVALQALGAESDIGVTLRSAAGEPIGLIAVISRRPIVDVRMAESILRVVAVRAEGELEREQAVRRLSDSETRWRFALEGAGDALWDWDVPAGTVFFSKRHKNFSATPRTSSATCSRSGGAGSTPRTCGA